MYACQLVTDGISSGLVANNCLNTLFTDTFSGGWMPPASRNQGARPRLVLGRAPWLRQTSHHIHWLITGRDVDDVACRVLEHQFRAGAASAPGLVPWSGLPWKTDSSLIDTLDLSVLAPDTAVSRVRAQAPMDTMPHVHMSLP